MNSIIDMVDLVAQNRSLVRLPTVIISLYANPRRVVPSPTVSLWGKVPQQSLGGRPPLTPSLRPPSLDFGKGCEACPLVATGQSPSWPVLVYTVPFTLPANAQIGLKQLRWVVLVMGPIVSVVGPWHELPFIFPGICVTHTRGTHTYKAAYFMTSVYPGH